jgi:hypothetical protein
MRKRYIFRFFVWAVIFFVAIIIGNSCKKSSNPYAQYNINAIEGMHLWHKIVEISYLCPGANGYPKVCDTSYYDGDLSFEITLVSNNSVNINSSHLTVYDQYTTNNTISFYNTDPGNTTSYTVLIYNYRTGEMTLQQVSDNHKYGGNLTKYSFNTP